MNIEVDWVKPFLLEQKVANIISHQSKDGCNFNVRQCNWNIHILNERISNIDIELIPMLPVMMHKGTEYKAPFKMNGQPKVFVQRYLDLHGVDPSVVGGPFTAVWFTPFDPGKTARVKAEMLDMGWVPTVWNNKKKDFNVWKIQGKLRNKTYAQFLKVDCEYEEAVAYDEDVSAFIKSHFVGKSKNYMRAILIALGFSLRKTPTFDEIKKKLLLSQFWPTSPKITEDSFESISDEDGMALKLLKERMVWAHRRSLLQGLLAVVRPDGKISGEANPCATPTARMKHKKIVNIPSAGSPFGEECRSLFTGNNRKNTPARVYNRVTREMLNSGNFRLIPGTNLTESYDSKKDKWEANGKRNILIPAGKDAFVGGDGAGLELRMLTHYLIAVSKMLLVEAEEMGHQEKVKYYSRALESAYEYRDVLLSGDIHSHNQRLAGLPTRSKAKTFIYAFLYGAGNANLGAQLGGDKSDGEKARAQFLKECPCIPVLMDWIQSFAATNGWVPAIDGRKLVMRRDSDGNVMTHKALNTLLQAAGSITMKVAMCFLHDKIRVLKIECNQVIMMHDEFQFSCKWEEVARLRKEIDSCVARAGIYLKMECPLASDSMLGANWLDTH